MPSFYGYRKATDSHSTYELQLPLPTEEQPGMIDLGEIDGVSYACVPDWMLPLPVQPKQIATTLKTVDPDSALIEKLLAAAPLLQLTKDRMEGKATRVRYSMQDELTLLQAKTVLPAVVAADAKTITIDEHVVDFRSWDKTAVIVDEKVIMK